MKTKSSPKTRKLLDRAIEIRQLPVIVSRPLASNFSGLSPRTLARAEKQGLLTPIKRNLASVAYDRSELLRFLGIEPSNPAVTSKTKSSPK